MQEGEKTRGCGSRVVGGIYLIGGGLWESCDRLPYELLTCQACGTGIHLPRTPQEIVPSDFFKEHEPLEDCRCWQEKQYGCVMCMPDNDPGYLMTVGRNNYTPESFLKEAHEQGVSKRIAQIPRHLELGKTVIYLGHPDACGKDKPGVFMGFIPKRIEQLVWKSETEKKREELEKKGITIVEINDGDLDHMPHKPGTKHYHLQTQPDGAIWGESYHTQSLARTALQALIASLREQGRKFHGNLADGFLDTATQASYSVIVCVDPAHLEQE